MSSTFWELLIILMLFLANGFFAGAEISVIAARRGRLQQLSAAGDRKARAALALARNPDQFLPTVQVGITLVGTFAAAFAGDRFVVALANVLEPIPVPIISRYRQGIALGLVVMGLTYGSLILGELVPKNIALQNAEGVARFVARPMHVLGFIARPFVWIMSTSTKAVLRLVGGKSAAENSVSLEDIRHLIVTGTAEGLLDPAEQKVALEALKLGDRTVLDIMHPRIDLDALDVNTPSNEVIGAMAMADFSRLPVYEGDLDHVIGFVHLKDVFRHLHLGWPIQLRKMLHPPLFVPRTLRLDSLLERFQTQKTHLAIVVDEYGGTDGMVTLDDVVAELLDNLDDTAHAANNEEFHLREDGSWLIDGGVSMLDLIEKLNMESLPATERRRFNTLAGLILSQLDHIPHVGERTRWNGYELEVVDMDGQRIDRVMLTPLPPSRDEGDSSP